ncbi:MAG: PAS domain-containing protein [Gemmatimonadales bacterium]
MTVSRSPQPTSARTHRERVLPYAVAVLSVALAGLLLQALPRFTAADARPALLVAVTISALVGGWGPGTVALLLVGFLSRDPGILLAGAALVAVCAIFRRAPVGKGSAMDTTAPEPAPGKPLGVGETPNGGWSAFAVETSRSAPPFLEVTTEATWRFHHEKPLDITLPEDEQVEHLYLYSSLAECNDAFARMYGFRTAVDVIGTRLVVFCPPSNSENVEYLRSFIRSGYRLEDAESQEIDRYGNAKYFVNNLVGIFERGQLVGAWGTQRDVTEQKGTPGSQEYLSRIHSTKSSSQ